MKSTKPLKQKILILAIFSLFLFIPLFAFALQPLPYKVFYIIPALIFLVVYLIISKLLFLFFERKIKVRIPFYIFILPLIIIFYFEYAVSSTFFYVQEGEGFTRWSLELWSHYNPYQHYTGIIFYSLFTVVFLFIAGFLVRLIPILKNKVISIFLIILTVLLILLEIINVVNPELIIQSSEKLATATRSELFCMFMPVFSGDSYRAECYEKVAMLKKNPTICERAKYPYSDFCYVSVAETIRDVSICEKIYSNTYKADCYSAVAIATENASICDKIISPETNTELYNNVSFYRYLRVSCYADVAKQTNNHSLCEKLINPNEISDCYRLKDF